MIKVKISKMKNFAISSKPASFDITLKNNNYIMKGEILVDFTKKTMRVYLDKALDYYEQLAVLKAIFYSFCITEAKKTKTRSMIHTSVVICKEKSRKMTGTIHGVNNATTPILAPCTLPWRRFITMPAAQTTRYKIIRHITFLSSPAFIFSTLRGDSGRVRGVLAERRIKDGTAAAPPGRGRGASGGGIPRVSACRIYFDYISLAEHI